MRRFGRDLAQGLYYLHSNGIIYADLKYGVISIIIISFRPSNVLLNEYSNLKLCDFGLAKKIVDLIQADSEG